jgi:MFS family permease
MSTKAFSSLPDRVDLGGYAKLYLFALVIVVVACLIGAVTFNVGPGQVVLLPMVWAILMGGALGLAARFLPPVFRLERPMQFTASAILQTGLLIFVAKLGLLVGGSLPAIAKAGWSLAFQEFGHFVGTILLGMPLALMLGIKREAVGATFSVGREPSLAIIGERYGMNSPEGRGVLAEYLTGTIFGAVFIAIFAGFIASLHLFSPLALAMGAGVGSGSLMAAAAGAIAALQTPEVAKQVATFAAASNLITTTIGTYFTLFISLPLAVWGYRVLEPVLGRMTRAGAAAALAESKAQETEGVVANAHSVDESGELSTTARWMSWLGITVLTLIGNQMLYKTSVVDALPGALIMLLAVAVGHYLTVAVRNKIPAVCVVSLIAMFLTSPWCPYAANVAAMTGKINFLAAVPAMLTFAGLSVAKDIPAFRRLGWRIVLVSFVANAGTFLGAAAIAQFFHHG